MKRVSVLVALVLAIAVVATMSAQAPSFEAVSIKTSTSGDPGGGMMTRPGRVSVHNLTLRNLIVNAYGVRDNQVDTGSAPGWVSSERFEIEATMPSNAPPPQVSQMMQALLADRFKLAVRQDTRNLPVYSLAPARSDGKLGPAMKAAQDPQCATSLGTGSAPQPGAGPRCGAVAFSPGQLTGLSVAAQQIVNALSRVPAVGRLVVDGGGLSGVFDFQLRWTPVNGTGGASADAPDSIFTALQEQLGLKLTPTQAPLPVIVVTDAQRPTAN